MSRAAVAGLVVLAVLAPATPARAAFPGANGKIAYSTNHDGNNEIYTINPDLSPGSNTRLTNNSSLDGDPAWSQDGTKIAFVTNRDGGNVDIYKMNADGTGQTRLTTNPAYDADPSWSPDGNQIVFTSDRDGDFELHKMNADGSGQTQLTFNSVADQFPAWSPDGQKIAYQTVAPILHDEEIFTINTDGSGITNLTNATGDDTAPSWSPDGTKLDFMTNRDNPTYVWVYQMNRDGSGQVLVEPGADTQFPAWSPDGTKLVASYLSEITGRDLAVRSSTPGDAGRSFFTLSGDETTPDWQPIVRNYARPKGATPIFYSFAPTYASCFQANSKHKGAITLPSCNPPTATSPYLTVGSPDANGQAANFVGSLRMSVFCNGGAPGETPPCLASPGDQLDGRLVAGFTDVRCAGTSGGCSSGALSDYTGDLLLSLDFTVTDRNSYGAGGATLVELFLPLPVPCSATADTTVGSTCSTTTTFDGIFGSGAIAEQKRAIWALAVAPKLYDGGPDGVSTTSSGNRLFADSGLFFP